MLIQHPSEITLGQPPENAFVAFDAHGRTVGAAAVNESVNAALYPEYPLRYRLDVFCPPEAFGVLIGAALARAMMLRIQKPELRARVYLECDPSDELRLQEAKRHGFQPDDALLKYRRAILHAPITAAMPEGCMPMTDQLDDFEERGYYLHRYAELHRVSLDEARQWLSEKRAMPKFARMLMVSRDGLVGELTLWVENRVCEIGMVYVSPEWRGRGVGVYLIEMARVYLAESGVPEAFLLLPKSNTAALRMAAAAGYRQTDIIKLYAGMNLA